MRTALLAILSVGALAVAGCDAPGAKTETAPAAAPAAAPAPVPEPAAAPEPAPTTTPGLTEAYKTEADWVKACSTATPPVPESVCTCVAKAAIKEVGADVLYDWLFGYFVNNDGFAKSRADRWFTSKGLDKAKMQKGADVTGKCYVK
jgi:hypothetical protein